LGGLPESDGDMPNKVFCKDCPCIYSSDQGYFCALGYSYTYKYENGEHIYFADDCELEVIRFAGVEFRPTKRASDDGNVSEDSVVSE
jgi:hypothetical protein